MSTGLLTTALIDLSGQLAGLQTSFFIGGGFGLYLKQNNLAAQSKIRTIIAGEFWPSARATEDIDFLLPTEIVANLEQMQAIRKALDDLGYQPKVKNMQFVKEIQGHEVKVDLMTCEFDDDDRAKLNVNLPRIRPRGKSVGLHACHTPEALALTQSFYELTLNGQDSYNNKVEIKVKVPNPFTYLLMKLHAFDDRKDRDHENESKTLAAHHALDCYRIIAMMTKEEEAFTKTMVEEYTNQSALVRAQNIIKGSFATVSAIGVLRAIKGARDGGGEITKENQEVFVESLHDIFIDSSN